MAKTFSRAAALAALSLSFAACTPLDNALASVPFLAFMRNAPFFDPYEAPRNAPPGSIPFESPAGAYMAPLEPTDAALNAFAASPAGQNPYAHEDSAALAHGQKMYERHCAVCHGDDATGNGRIVGPGKFPMNPPNLITSGRSEGYIYGIIRTGRTLMPSYGARTSHTDRWAIATYIQHLQAQAGSAAAPAPAAATTTPAAAPAPAGQETP